MEFFDQLSQDVRFTLYALAFGFAVSLSVWLIARILSTVPEEDREYLDPPPLAFRVFWKPIHWTSHFVSPFFAQAAREKLRFRLRQAGLDFSLNPTQFISARLVAVVVGTFLAVWVTRTLFPAAGVNNEGSFFTLVYAAIGGALLGWFLPAIWLRDRLRKRKLELLRTIPYFLDFVTLCIEAGLNIQGALTQVAMKGPSGILRDEVQRVLRDIRAGKPRANAMQDMAERMADPAISSFVTAVLQAERMGMNLGNILRAQAEQRRIERFQRAEKLAMEAPVKMLLPLVACIFPCTFIVLLFPIAVQILQMKH